MFYEGRTRTRWENPHTSGPVRSAHVQYVFSAPPEQKTLFHYLSVSAAAPAPLHDGLLQRSTGLWLARFDRSRSLRVDLELKGWKDAGPVQQTISRFGDVKMAADTSLGDWSVALLS